MQNFVVVLLEYNVHQVLHVLIVDNPNDSCDPKNGGADCGGFCKKCLTLCAKPNCKPNEQIITLLGTCCPTCIPKPIISEKKRKKIDFLHTLVF